MKMTYTPKFNFHNAPPLVLVIDSPTVECYDGDECYPVSESQRQRLAKHFCGVQDCRCNSAALIELDSGKFGIPAKFCQPA